VRYPPGPKPTSLLGNMPLSSPDPLGTYSRWAAEYGDIFHYRFLWNHIYFLSNPDHIDYVLVRNASNFIKDRTTRNSRWLLGDGLVISEGELWLRQRRLIQPAFHRDRIAGYAAIMTAYTRDMLAGWRNGAVLDIHREMMQLTLRVVVRSLFGMETGETQAISRSLDLVASNNTGFRLLLPPMLRNLPLPGAREHRRAVDDLNGAVQQIISQHRRSNQQGDDLLAMLMAARDEDGNGMSDKQLRDEVMTFFLAGHETTALALSWALYLLSRNPDAEAKLRQELDRVLGARPAEMSDLPSLVWTDCIIKEAMRLYPPAWAVGRAALKEFELGGYVIPKGAIIAMSQWIVHRDARYFPDPEKFDPGRWMPERAQKLPRFAYFPFGGGRRQCVGNAFATMEAVLALAAIAQRFQVRVAADYVARPMAGFTLRPCGGIPASTIGLRPVDAPEAQVGGRQI
jgi:cytochrome P450